MYFCTSYRRKVYFLFQAYLSNGSQYPTIMNEQIQVSTPDNAVAKPTASGKRRLFYIDALRGLAMLLTVIGHLSVYCYKDLDYSIFVKFAGIFRMPLFMMISGSLINFSSFSIRKRLKNLIPFFFFGILYALLIHGSIIGFMTSLFKYGYWFLWALIIFNSFVFVILKTKSNLLVGFVMVEVFLLVLYVISRNTTFEYLFSLKLLIPLWPFFFLGIMMKHGGFEWFAQRSKLTFTVSVLLVISVLLADSLFDVSAWPYRLDDIMNRAMAFPICVSLMLVFYYAEKICKGKTSPVKSCLKSIGTMVGTNTLQIYVLHFFIFYFMDLSAFGQYMIKNNKVWLELIVSPVLAIAASYACVYASKLIYKMHLGIVFGRVMFTGK